MANIAASHKDKWFDYRQAVLLGVHLDSELCSLMAGYTVFQFDNFYLVGSEIILVEISGFGDSRIFDIQPIVEGFGEIVFKHNILERTSFLVERCGSHFKTENRAKFIDSTFRGISVVSVCLVHQHNEIGQRSKIIKVGLTEVFRQATHTRQTFRAFLAILVKFRDVENINLYIREQTTRALVIGFSCNDAWRCGDKFAYTFEYIFRIGFVTEVFYQLLI